VCLYICVFVYFCTCVRVCKFVCMCVQPLSHSPFLSRTLAFAHVLVPTLPLLSSSTYKSLSLPVCVSCFFVGMCVSVCVCVCTRGYYGVATVSRIDKIIGCVCVFVCTAHTRSFLVYIFFINY